MSVLYNVKSLPPSNKDTILYYVQDYFNENGTANKRTLNGADINGDTEDFEVRKISYFMPEINSNHILYCRLIK